ncbi:hypothetical protein [Caldisericum sp.]|uniref:hypothetical protein n=1 Tax=Caldisericum sp. TaxID=2499687 RepID=UPI003D0D705D
MNNSINSIWDNLKNVEIKVLKIEEGILVLGNVLGEDDGRYIKEDPEWIIPAIRFEFRVGFFCIEAFFDKENLKFYQISRGLLEGKYWYSFIRKTEVKDIEDVKNKIEEIKNWIKE